METQEQLFKFMVVRSVSKSPETEGDLRFIRSPSHNSPKTTFTKSVASATDETDAKRLATEFIGKAQHTNLAKSRFLDAVADVAAFAADDGKTGEAVEMHRAVTGLVHALPRNDQLPKMNNVVWDSLIALSLIPLAERDLQGILVRAVQGVALGLEIDGLASDDDVRRLAAAVPVLPVWLNTYKGQASDTQPDDNDTPAPRPGRQRKQKNRYLKQIKERRRKLADLVGAAKEISRARVSVNAASRTETADDPAAGGLLTRAGRLETTLSAASLKNVEVLDGAIAGWRDLDDDDLDSVINARIGEHSSDIALFTDAGSMSKALRTGDFNLDEMFLPLAERFDLGDDDVTGAEEEQEQEELEEAPEEFANTIGDGKGKVVPCGYGDLLITKQTLLGYEETEIAHVENVMDGEFRERSHRFLSRSEESYETSTTESSESEKDLQTEERFEVAKQSREEISSRTDASFGLSISSYGPTVWATTDVGLASTNSRSSGRSTSSTYAKDVVSNTVSRISESVSTSYSRTITRETEENNTHRFEAESGNGQSIGIYQWLEKIYQGQVWNYGKRLMMEFVVPEPAAFYKHAQGMAASRGVGPGSVEPLGEGFNFTHVDSWSYKNLMAEYFATDVEAPPPAVRYVTDVVKLNNQSDEIFASDTFPIEIPVGYKAHWIFVSGLWDHKPERVVQDGSEVEGTDRTIRAFTEPLLSVTAGSKALTENPDSEESDYKEIEWNARLQGQSDTLPVGVSMRDSRNATLTIQVVCHRTNEAYVNWQIDTYGKIVTAYQRLESERKQELTSKQMASMSSISSQSPGQKRAIEKEELKRGCLQILSGQHFLEFDATQGDVPPFGYPEFDIDEAMSESEYVRFFEQSFEWENMTYSFYPYYWGRKGKWIENRLDGDDDPAFNSFMRAGSARVVLPVRPGAENSMVYFLKFGGVWSGEQAPVPGDEFYFSIADEAAVETNADLAEPEEYGDPWQYKVATSLVKLRDGTDLPQWPLPDSEDPEES